MIDANVHKGSNVKYAVPTGDPGCEQWVGWYYEGKFGLDGVIVEDGNVLRRALSGTKYYEYYITVKTIPPKKQSEPKPVPKKENKPKQQPKPKPQPKQKSKPKQQQTKSKQETKPKQQSQPKAQHKPQPKQENNPKQQVQNTQKPPNQNKWQKRKLRKMKT